MIGDRWVHRSWESCEEWVRVRRACQRKNSGGEKWHIGNRRKTASRLCLTCAPTEPSVDLDDDHRPGRRWIDELGVLRDH